jgi:tol-pal system protein YbgF
MGTIRVKLPRTARHAGAALVAIVMGLAGGAGAGELAPNGRAAMKFAQNDLPPALVPGEPGDMEGGEAATLVLRIDRLEAALRRANGQIEELQNDNHRLEDRLQRFQQDVEFRLGGGAPGAAPPPPAVAAAEPPKPRKGDAFDPEADPSALGAPRPLGSTPPSPPLGTPLAIRPPPPASAPLELGAHPPSPGPVKAADAEPTVINSGLGFTDGPREQFNGAVASYKAGQYADAEAQLKAFLAANPTHARAPDAIFYLGETYLQRSRPREAAEQYLKLSTDFGKSAKAPEGMMRLGQSLAMLGDNEQACATFTEVGKRYPTASGFVKKSVEREMQSHHCQ